MLQKICVYLLFGFALQSVGVDGNVCDDRIFKINSTTHFVQVIKGIQDSSSQKNCSVLEFEQSSFELDLNETLNISTNMTLCGAGAIITCIYPYGMFNYSAIIRVTNTHYFGISGITFLECPLSLHFENVTSISINDSHFRDFNKDPVYLFNCPSVSVINSTFINNTSTARYIFRSFEANAAGLSYGWNNLLLGTQPSIDVYVYNCTFANNVARGVVRDFDPTTDALETRTFAGRGGGMAIILNATSNVTVVIEKTKFKENHANGFGGGFYLLIDGISINQYFYTSHNTFENNTANFGGAAINVGYLSIIPQSTINEVIIKDSNIIGNQAGLVGAIGLALTYTFGLTNFIRIINCNFYAGAAIGLFHLDFLSAKTEVQPVEIIDCEFAHNICGSGGILGVGYFPVTLKGNVTFINNTGPAFRVVASVVHVKGAHLTFMGNNAGASSGGAMYLTSYTQVYLSQGSTFDFIKNTGRSINRLSVEDGNDVAFIEVLNCSPRIGASVVIETQEVPQLFSKTANNQFCFLQFEQEEQQSINLPPEKWKGVTFNFEGNVAIVGSAFYIDRISQCSWSRILYPYFSLNDTLKWSFINYSPTNNNTGHDDGPNNNMFDLQTPPVYFDLIDDQVSSYPGQDVPIKLKAYDELNHTSAAIFRIDLNESEGNILQFYPSAYLYEPNDDVLEVKYSLNDLSKLKGSLVGVSVNSQTVNDTSTEQFILLLKPCQPGYRLQSPRNMGDSYTCLCDDDESIKTCMGSNIILKNGLWAHYTGGNLIFHHCPTGYCRCHVDMNHNCLSIYTGGNESLQCACDRQGLLCGMCKEGKGVSTLLNTCQSCISVGWLLIIVLIIVNIIVALVVVIREIKFSSWMFPFTYYVQVLPYMFQNLTLSSSWNNYLYYFNSVLSLYFPYDFCLFKEMDAVLSYGLRYIPIVITTSVCIILFIVYTKFKITSWKFSWNGVWTLLLLQYSHIVHTSISILNCSGIPEQESDTTQKWYINANIQCFHGTHIIIGTIAIIFLVISILLVPFVGIISCGYLFKDHEHWKKVAIALSTNSSNPNYKWWCSAELGRRLLIIAIILPFPGNEILPLLMSIVIFTFYLYFLPTETKRDYSFTVIFETILLGQIVMMLSLKTTNYIQDSLAQTFHSDTENGCQNTQVLTKLGLVLLVLYYIPVLIVLLYLAFRLVKWINCFEWITTKRLSTTRSFCNNDQVEYLLDPYRSTMVGSSYVAVEDDGTVILSHNKL